MQTKQAVLFLAHVCNNTEYHIVSLGTSYHSHYPVMRKYHRKQFALYLRSLHLLSSRERQLNAG